MSAVDTPRLHTDASHELEVLLRSRIPLLLIESRDETRVLQMLASIWCGSPATRTRRCSSGR